MKKVSVVIPCYNSSKYIVEAIDSVLSQTSKAIEVIVVDDGSTDGSGDLVASTFGDRVQLIRQENQGRVGARKTGFKVALGDWIALLDADDYWAPNKLEEQIHTLEKAPSDIVIVHTNCALVNSDNKTLYNYKIPDVISFGPYFHRNSFHTSSVLLKKEVLIKVIEHWNLGRYRAQDYGLFLLMLCHGSALFVDKVLSYYRIHDDNNHDDAEFDFGVIKSRENVIEYLSMNNLNYLLPVDWQGVMSKCNFDYGWYVYVNKNYSKAQPFFKSAYLYDKFNILALAYWMLLSLSSCTVDKIRKFIGSKSV